MRWTDYGTVHSVKQGLSLQYLNACMVYFQDPVKRNFKKTIYSY